MSMIYMLKESYLDQSPNFVTTLCACTSDSKLMDVSGMEGAARPNRGILAAAYAGNRKSVS